MKTALPEKIESLLYWAEEIYLYFDSNLNLVDLNNAGLIKSGLGPEEVLGKNLGVLCPDIKQSVLFKKITNVLKNGKPLVLNDLTCQIFGAKYINLKAFKLDEGLGMIVTDVTDIRHNKEKILQSQTVLRSLSLHLQSLREKEGRRIARHMHEEMAPVLTALKMDLCWIGERIHNGADNSPVTKQKISSMVGIIDTTIDSVQKICEELRPVALDDLGLLPAIEWQVQEFKKRTACKCYFISQVKNLDELDPSYALCLYRIIQEGLTNIIRHAEATEVIITLRRIPRSNMIELVIKDNGQGATKAEIRSPKSFGFIGMRERLIPFGGKLIIKGIEKRGTTLTVNLPFQHKKENGNGLKLLSI